MMAFCPDAMCGFGVCQTCQTLLDTVLSTMRARATALAAVGAIAATGDYARYEDLIAVYSEAADAVHDAWDEYRSHRAPQLISGFADPKSSRLYQDRVRQSFGGARGRSI